MSDGQGESKSKEKLGAAPPQELVASNFLRQQIEQDLSKNKYASRRWAGQPGPAALQRAAPLDPAKL